MRNTEEKIKEASYIIAKYLMLIAKSRLKLSLSGSMFKEEESFAKPVYQTSPDPSIYFNISISFNPFSILGKKH
ncbi:hypothetical protein ACFU8T_12265 [Sphingobacterium spiritivorum]|uniref:hypothetical protein n=1 Tax=Sphingobacterium spiritivorum TaxID=258 RepID=UPI00369B885D